MLTQNYIKKLVHYCPDTGVFTRLLKSGNGYRNGAINNKPSTHGYLRISINNRQITEHRLAFLYMNGYFPENDVDHIDGVKTNNKWSNLREVSPSCNLQNTAIFSSNTSGFPGVHLTSTKKQWEASITIKGNSVYIGRFTDVMEAALARMTCELNHPGWTCDMRNSLMKAIRDNGFPNLLPRYKK